MDEMGLNFESIVENIYDGLYFVDRNRRITYWNKAAERITGFMKHEVVGRCCADNILIHVDGQGCELCKHQCPLAATIHDGQAREAEVFLHHQQGHRVPVLVRVTPLRDEAGNITGGIELFSEMNSQAALRQKISELEKLALLDPLTGMSNRRHLSSVLAAQFAMRQCSGMPFGILCMDIDDLKKFHDAHGQQIGARVFQVISNTLTAAVRPFDTVGCWDSEKFLMIFPNTNEETLSRLADRLCMLVRNARVRVQDETLRMTVSVGGAIAKDHDTPESFLKRVEALRCRSKAAGGDRAVMG